jgi:hypothetical protein
VTRLEERSALREKKCLGNEKSPRRCRFGLFSGLNNTLAVFYSPTTLRLQYHRRWRA